MKPMNNHLHRQKNGMSIHAEIMLDMIASSKSDRKILDLMQEAIDLKVGSYITLYNAITWLDQNGFISAKKDNERDGRAKFCGMTKKGKKYHEAL